MENKKFEIFSRLIQDHEILSKEQDLELGFKIKNDPLNARENKDKLILSNIRLVISIASEYRSLADWQDLVSEGIIGLHKAAEKYDPSFNVRFSSYSSYWIRQHLVKAVRDAQLIKIPEYSYRKYSQIMEFRGKHKEKFGNYPTLEFLAKKFKTSVNQINSLIESRESAIYLNAEIGGESGEELSDITEDPNWKHPDFSILQKESIEVLNKLLENLNEKEKVVVKGRFGLGDTEELTLQSIGKELKVTRERVRQIEASALKKMQSSALKNSDLRFLFKNAIPLDKE